EITYDRENNQGGSNLLDIYASATDQRVEPLVEAHEGKTYGQLNVDLAAVVTRRLEPIRTRPLELLDDPAELDRIRAVGAEKARSVAAPVLDEVYKKTGFLPLGR